MHLCMYARRPVFLFNIKAAVGKGGGFMLGECAKASCDWWKNEIIPHCILPLFLKGYPHSTPVEAIPSSLSSWERNRL